jgi:ligand-binding sensor domain-containing protein
MSRRSGVHLDWEEKLWYGNAEGVSCTDGDTVITFTSEDELAGRAVTCIAQGRMGHMWFGIDGSGVSRYDGEQFTTGNTHDP